MNVRELIDMLDEYGDHLTVVIDCQDVITEEITGVIDGRDTNGMVAVIIVAE